MSAQETSQFEAPELQGLAGYATLGEATMPALTPQPQYHLGNSAVRGADAGSPEPAFVTPTGEIIVL